jgi:protoporphyrinogen/coproporphyrinogen III oxidase
LEEAKANGVRHVAIIGGGVAGLTVAFRRSQLGDRVSVFEAAERLGGQLHTEHSAGFLIEHGAEGFVAGSDALARLAAAVGIEQELREQLVRDSCHFDGAQLTRLGPGEAGKLLGFQVGARALGRGIQSFQQGMSALVDALRAHLPAEARVELERSVLAIEREAPAGLRLTLAAGAPQRADAVVVATSAADAARLLAPGWGPSAAALALSEALSSVTVSLAYPRERVPHPLDATGFVVAEAAQLEGFRACTFASSKLAGRAPAEDALLRLFFRPTPADLTATDADWVLRAERCAARALGPLGAAERAWVSRWERALPVFDDAHRARVAALQAALRGSDIVLAGAAFHGSGIDGAVRSAEAAVQALSAR